MILLPKKKSVLGIKINPTTLANLPQFILFLLKEKKKKTFFYVNAHCINISFQDLMYRDILNQADLVYSGGLGPVLASKILGQPLIERTPTPDFINQIFLLSITKKWSFYFLGSDDASLISMVKKIEQKFPFLDIKGFHNGYFDKKEETKIIEHINKLKPTFVIVGMGTPKQEKWIFKNFQKIDAKIFWAVGAMFDVLSGTRPRAPKWLQKMGLEWLYRLFQEPKRLWERYTLGNIKFIYYVLEELFVTKKASR